MEEQAARLKAAIDAGDGAAVRALMIGHPALHRAKLGYGGAGPLTWVAECRVPRRAPDAARLEMARWMIEQGSDVHQGGDAPLMRAALDRERIPMMELLVAHGADVNARWHGEYPILYAPCETLDATSLQWLLAQGAAPGEALDYLLGTYLRNRDALSDCVEVLLEAGARTKHPAVVLAVMLERLDQVRAWLDAEPDGVHQFFAHLDIGTTAGRMLTLRGGTLLHVAAEFQSLETARLLLDRGADVNARSGDGATAIFHAATQTGDAGLPMVQLLVEHGADLSMRARVPGHYEREGEMLECTAVAYAKRFPGDGGATWEYLRARVAPQRPRA